VPRKTLTQQLKEAQEQIETLKKEAKKSLIDAILMQNKLLGDADLEKLKTQQKIFRLERELGAITREKEEIVKNLKKVQNYVDKKLLAARQKTENMEVELEIEKRKRTKMETECESLEKAIIIFKESLKKTETERDAFRSLIVDLFNEFFE